MMVFNVSKTVAHFRFAASEALTPQRPSVALDRYRHRYRFKLRIDNQFWPESAGAELRACQIQIVLLLELMVGKLVADRQSQPVRLSFWPDEVHASNLSFFSSVFGVSRDFERLAMGAQHRSGSLIEPFGRRPDRTISRAPSLHSPAENLHAVSQLFFLDGVHRLAIASASQMSEPCS